MPKALSVESFLEQLAAKTSTPGGGCAAATSGAMGAALLSMVINFTLGKRGYEAVQKEFSELLPETEQLRLDLLQAMQDDVDTFNRVMAAYRMPKEEGAQRAARDEELQAALQAATDAPLECARLCHQVMLHSRTVAEKGSAMVISDAGVAVVAAHAGLMSAALNVRINVANIKDGGFVNERQQRLETMQNEADALKRQVYSLVVGRL